MRFMACYSICVVDFGAELQLVGYGNHIDRKYVAVNPVVGYKTHMAISGNQLKAARALIGLDQKELADRAKVGINTIRNMEGRGVNRVRVRTDTLDAIVDALKASGVVFLEENGEGAGVRLKK
jgi:DNA-binding Xre family transcriptional regulator